MHGEEGGGGGGGEMRSDERHLDEVSLPPPLPRGNTEAGKTRGHAVAAALSHRESYLGSQCCHRCTTQSFPGTGRWRGRRV